MYYQYYKSSYYFKGLIFIIQTIIQTLPIAILVIFVPRARLIIMAPHDLPPIMATNKKTSHQLQDEPPQ